MKEQFELFLREKRYVQNVADNTVEFYKYSFQAFERNGLDFNLLSRTHFTGIVASMREGGMSINCTDSYIRGFNPFLTWLHDNDYTTEHYKIQRLKLEKKVMKSFTDSQIKAIINYKPKDYYGKRIHTLLLLLCDTGIRINEALTLTREKIDFDNLLVTVKGKGNKERIVPFSIELRKALSKFLKCHKYELVFCNWHGAKLIYNNMRRDFNKMVKSLGITGFDGSFHAFRRSFATNYIRSNGNPFILQRMLGHTTLKQTNEYVKLITEDLSKEQGRTSFLTRLR